MITLTRQDLENIIVTTAMGINPQEVELALDAMDNTGDNAASFGVNRCFITSCIKEDTPTLH